MTIQIPFTKQKIQTFFFLILTFFIYNPNSFADSKSLDNIFTDKTEGVSFNFPTSWEIQNQKTNAFLVRISRKNGTGESCMLKTNLNEALSNISSEDFVKALTPQDIISMGKQSQTELNITDFKKTKVGNRPALFYEASLTYQSLSSRIPMKMMVVMLKVNDRMYSFGCTSHAMALDFIRPVFLSILNSLIVRY